MTYYFYDATGNVNLIYYVKPPKEVLEKNKNYITSDQTFKEKEGFFINFTVNLDTKELISEYLPIPPRKKTEIELLQEEVATLKKQINVILTKLKITL